MNNLGDLNLIAISKQAGFRNYALLIRYLKRIRANRIDSGKLERLNYQNKQKEIKISISTFILIVKMNFIFLFVFASSPSILGFFTVCSRSLLRLTL